MLRLQPVLEMNLPTAQLICPEMKLALSLLEEGGATSVYPGKKPSSP